MGRPQRFRGVRQRHWGSWVSEIRHPSLKTRVWLGTFETAEDAAHAYDEAARLMCGVKARTNFPYDPKRPSSQLLSATLTAKLHRWYLQSQQQESQPKSTKGAAAAQSLTCLCLDNQQSNLGIYHKKPGCQEVRNVEFAAPATTADLPQSSASSFTSDDNSSSSWSEEDKFAAEMIEELLSWSSSSTSSSFTSQLDSSCSSSFTPSSSSLSATFVM